MKFVKDGLILVNQKTIAANEKMKKPLHLATVHDPKTYDNQEFILQEPSTLQPGDKIKLLVNKDGRYWNAEIVGA